MLKTAGLKALKGIAEKIEDWLDSDCSKDTDKVVKAVVDDIVKLEECVTKFETDLSAGQVGAQDKPMVHRVDGQYSDSHYLDAGVPSVFQAELFVSQWLDDNSEISHAQ